LFDILVTVQYVSIIFLFLETAYVFKKMKTRAHAYLFLNCVATLINNVGYLIQMLAKNENEYLAGLKFAYLGKVWIPFSLLVFAFTICRMALPKGIIYSMSGISITTFLLVLTCTKHNLYYQNMKYVSEGVLVPYIKSNHGVWHTVYNIFLVLYIVTGITILIRATFRERNPVAKKRIAIATMAITVDSLGFFAYLTKITSSYDATVIGYTIGSLFMFVAMYKYKLLETLEIAKDYVVDELSEAIISVNNDGFPEYYNKPAHDIMVKNIISLPDFVKKMDVALEEHEPIEFSDKIYTPQVKELFSEGAHEGKLYVLSDDTEHYRYMEELKAQKEIAERASTSKSSFVSIVSHELRTPINAIVGMTDILMGESEHFTVKQEKYLKNIKNSGETLGMIVNDILDRSKIESGKIELIEAPYELRPILSDIKMIIENRIGNKSVHAIIDVSDNVPVCLMGDYLKIRQILINLMNNSVKFTNEGFVKLSVTALEEKEGRKKLRFAVSDTGQGIKPSDLFKLGEAFVQVDTKYNYGKEGTGLGLSISKDFVSIMGGQLEISSEYGKGSEFAFNIWQGIANVDEIESCSEASKEKHQAENFKAPKAKLLAVDDNDVNLLIIEEMLAPSEMTVVKATSGAEALEKITSDVYDVVLMDYVMIDMDGVEVTEKIRDMANSSEVGVEQADYYKHVPIIAMSGDSSDETREKFMRAGIDDFVDKPVNIKELKNKLYKWIDDEKIEF